MNYQKAGVVHRNRWMSWSSPRAFYRTWWNSNFVFELFEIIRREIKKIVQLLWKNWNLMVKLSAT